jgi:hypothetical protein
MFKLAILAIALSLFGFAANASPYAQHADDVHVNGYTRDNGTYVQPHYRSAPNSHHNGY